MQSSRTTMILYKDKEALILLVLIHFDTSNLLFKVNFSDDLHLRVVPNHDFVGKPFRLVPSTDESHYICSIKKLNVSDSSLKL